MSETFISKMNFHFNKVLVNVLKLLHLVPYVVAEESDPASKLKPVFSVYESDLPNDEIVDQEIMLWKKFS